MEATPSFSKLLTQLTGSEPTPLTPEDANWLPRFPDGGLGYSQLNEALLAMGYARVPDHLFEFIRSTNTDYRPGNAIDSLADFWRGVESVRQLCMLTLGSFANGFDYLSRASKSELEMLVRQVSPVEIGKYLNRHNPTVPLERIADEDTPLLGYISGRRLTEAAKQRPNDEAAKQKLAHRERIVAVGKRNHAAYLFSDHLDVYVATSMREDHDFLVVAQFCRSVFEDDRISELKVRYFDPTQAFCDNRIDKGLAEALMLKRARCTIYLIQESDTLGKDSELASTLAQGKTVIAYVPSYDLPQSETHVRQLLADPDRAVPCPDRAAALLRSVAPHILWESSEEASAIREWRDSKERSVTDEIVRILAKRLRDSHDRRAKTLREDHPLGLQVELNSGLAVGVLVARQIDDVVRLLRGVLTNSLKFEINSPEADGPWVLRESISGSVFRVVSGDAALTHAFWAFYRDDDDPSEKRTIGDS